MIAYQSSPNILNDFYNDSFNFKRFNPLPLLMQAKRDGVEVNLQLLHQLFNKPNAYTTMRPLLLEENASWVIAALCGDLKWLLSKFAMIEIPMYAIAENHVDFFDQFIEKFGNTFTGKSGNNGWKISHFVLSSANCRTIRKMLEEHKIDLTETNNDKETALVMLAKLAVRCRSKLTWMVIADILGAFNKSFHYQLHTMPDNTGLTLENLIIQHNKQDLFPDLNFVTSSPSLK